MEDMRLDQLNDQEKNEVIMIVFQESPLDIQPRTQVEWSFLNEEVHREARLELERQEDIKRWNRLVELGAVDSPDDLDFDWEQVEP